jgi:hypothetical protein
LVRSKMLSWPHEVCHTNKTDDPSALIYSLGEQMEISVSDQAMNTSALFSHSLLHNLRSVTWHCCCVTQQFVAQMVQTSSECKTSVYDSPCIQVPHRK